MPFQLQTALDSDDTAVRLAVELLAAGRSVTIITSNAAPFATLVNHYFDRVQTIELDGDTIRDADEARAYAEATRPGTEVLIVRAGQDRANRYLRR